MLRIITMKGRDGGVIGRVTDEPHLGVVVLFTNPPDAPGKVVFCYDYHERTSRQGRRYFLCSGWSEDERVAREKYEETRRKMIEYIKNTALEHFPQEYHSLVKKLLEGQVPTRREVRDAGLYAVFYNPDTIPVRPGEMPGICVCGPDGEHYTTRMNLTEEVIAEGLEKVRPEHEPYVIGRIPLIECEFVRLTPRGDVIRAIDRVLSLHAPEEFKKNVIKKIVEILEKQDAG